MADSRTDAPAGLGRPLIISWESGRAAGEVRPGERWLDAAIRCSAGVGSAATLVPVDLSADPMRFTLLGDVRVALRPMTRGDLRDLSRWRGAEHVARWWAADGPSDLDAVTAQYGDQIDGLSPTRIWVIEVNGRSVGFIQDYRLRDYPDYAVLCPDPGAVGLDYAIGEPEWIGRGLGPRALWAWILQARERFPEVTAYFAAPDHRNLASLRALEKVGFRQGLWFDEPRQDGGVDTVVGCTFSVNEVLGRDEPEQLGRAGTQPR